MRDAAPARMTANTLTNDLLIAISERYRHRACVFRANVIVARAKRGTVRSLPSGTPDVIGVVDGVPLGLEIKAGRDRLSDVQQRFRAAWDCAGGLYIVARSVEQAMSEIEGRIPR